MIYWHQLYLLLLCCLLSLSALGQHGAGVKFGLDFNKNLSTFNSINIGDSLILNNFSPQREGNVGIWLKLSSNRVYAQTEFLIFSTQERYQINFLNTNNKTEMISNNRIFLELPFLAGIKLQSFNIYAGIAPRISLNTPKKLSEWFDLERHNASIYLKYILGVDLNLGSLIVGLRYNNQLSSQRDVMIINDIVVQPIDHIERFTLSVAINLLKD